MRPATEIITQAVATAIEGQREVATGFKGVGISKLAKARDLLQAAIDAAKKEAE